MAGLPPPLPYRSPNARSKLVPPPAPSPTGPRTPPPPPSEAIRQQSTNPFPPSFTGNHDQMHSPSHNTSSPGVSQWGGQAPSQPQAVYATQPMTGAPQMVPNQQFMQPQYAAQPQFATQPQVVAYSQMPPGQTVGQPMQVCIPMQAPQPQMYYVQPAQSQFYASPPNGVRYVTPQQIAPGYVQQQYVDPQYASQYAVHPSTPESDLRRRRSSGCLPSPSSDGIPSPTAHLHMVPPKHPARPCKFESHNSPIQALATVMVPQPEHSHPLHVSPPIHNQQMYVVSPPAQHNMGAMSPVPIMSPPRKTYLRPVAEYTTPPPTIRPASWSENSRQDAGDSRQYAIPPKRIKDFPSNPEDAIVDDLEAPMLNLSIVAAEDQCKPVPIEMTFESPKEATERIKRRKEKEDHKPPPEPITKLTHKPKLIRPTTFPGATTPEAGRAEYNMQFAPDVFIP
eukprot:112648_1